MWLEEEGNACREQGGGRSRKEGGRHGQGRARSSAGERPHSARLTLHALKPRSDEDFIRDSDFPQFLAPLGVSASHRINSHLSELTSSRRFFLIRQMETLVG